MSSSILFAWDGVLRLRSLEDVHAFTYWEGTPVLYLECSLVAAIVLVVLDFLPWLGVCVCRGYQARLEKSL